MEDEKYMNLALQLALRAKGRTSPNPLVGALVVKNNRIVGRGYHKKAGAPHAEVNALNVAGPKAHKATLYLTLEPCAHFGRTPPCTGKIISSGIRKVVVAMLDPNPLNNGKGVRELRRAGIEVEVGSLREKAKRINESYIKYITAKRPFVILKSALSLDGKIATRRGDAKWISNELSRKYVHRLRSDVDAILVGSGTIRKDNPRLTARTYKKNPIRIVVDSKARISPAAKVLNREAPTIIATTKFASPGKIAALSKKGVRVLVVKDKDKKVDLTELLKMLGKLEITSLLVEGGGTINAAFLENGLVDKLLFFIAPQIIGGKEAPTAVEGEGIEKMSGAIKLKDITTKRFGEDILIEGYIS
jgi:diaminohydroxyphosphoribosylaminopyrimidine deaminase/5-amino-6-(5-phosphoribosylamino)uracil reductase